MLIFRAKSAKKRRISGSKAQIIPYYVKEEIIPYFGAKSIFLIAKNRLFPRSFSRRSMKTGQKQKCANRTKPHRQPPKANRRFAYPPR